MSRTVGWILIAFVLAAQLGCSGERDKGKYKDLDKPKPANEG